MQLTPEQIEVIKLTIGAVAGALSSFILSFIPKFKAFTEEQQAGISILLACMLGGLFASALPYTGLIPFPEWPLLLFSKGVMAAYMASKLSHKPIDQLKKLLSTAKKAA